MPKKKGLTEPLMETLKLIWDYTEANGYPPSVRELTEGRYYSCSSVQEHIRRLCKMGYLTKKPKLARSVKLTEKGMNALW